MLVMALLLIGSPLQAQNWVNSQSLMMNTSLKTDVYAQKVKVYDTKRLISLSKYDDSVKYCFSLWVNNNNLVYNSFIDTTGVTINDFTVLGDSIYFCGNIETAPNTWHGILGRFNVNDFLDDGNFSYNFTYIPNTINLTRLVACYSGVDTVSLMAIGHDTLNDVAPGRVVQLYFNTNTGNLFCNKFNCSSLPNTQKEIMHDICLSNNSVITLSHIYPTNQYVVRYFSQPYSSSNTSSYIYTFPNLQFNVSSNVYEFPLHLTNISSAKMAVCASVIGEQRYFTMVNFLKKSGPNISSTQLITHEDKSNKPLEMEYSSTNGHLLLLNDSYYSGQGMMQTIVYLNPGATSDYVSATEFFAKPNILNHFSIIPGNKYAVAGVNPQSTPSEFQMLAIKLTTPINNDCVDVVTPKITLITTPNGAGLSNIQRNQYSLGWYNGTATNNVNAINVYCN